MGYTRRRALLSEIERHCAVAMLAYSDSVEALKERDSERFWRSLKLLLAAAETLDVLLWPAPAESEPAAWLGISALSPLHRSGPRFLPDALDRMSLAECARFLECNTLPDLMAAVADLSHRAREQENYLRHVI